MSNDNHKGDIRLSMLADLLEKLSFEEAMLYPLTMIAGLVLLMALLTGIYQEAILVLFFLLLLTSYILAAILRSPRRGPVSFVILLAEVVLVIIVLNLLSPSGIKAFSVLWIVICGFITIGMLTSDFGWLQNISKH